jgi:hypothetical protein
MLLRNGVFSLIDFSCRKLAVAMEHYTTPFARLSVCCPNSSLRYLSLYVHLSCPSLSDVSESPSVFCIFICPFTHHLSACPSEWRLSFGRFSPGLFQAVTSKLVFRRCLVQKSVFHKGVSWFFLSFSQIPKYCLAVVNGHFVPSCFSSQ